MFLLFVWFFLSSVFLRGNVSSLDKDSFRSQYRDLGPISYEERIVLADFVG